MGLKSLTQALGNRLDTITTLQVFDFVPHVIVPPTAILGKPEVTYDLSAGGKASVRVPVHVLVGSLEAESSRDLLYPFLDLSGASSVRGAFNDDPTLNGESVPRGRVLTSEISEVTVNGVTYLAAFFQFQLYL